MSHHLSTVITIINPTAGADLPILGALHKVTTEQNIRNTVLVTQTASDTLKFARQAARQKPDAVIVHGGDGTIVDVAKGLSHTSIPLIIIPGGTANVIAKDLNIPLDIAGALEVLQRKPKHVQMNAAKIGRQKMYLRVEVGIMANMVQEASKSLKENLGVVAYPLTALQELAKIPAVEYTIIVDGKRKKLEGIGLMVANVGNIGLPGISLQKNVKSSDNLLDVFILQSSDIATLIAVGSSAIVGTPKPVALKHWQGKEISVRVKPKQNIICDDAPLKASQFTVKLLDETLDILV